MGLRLFEAEGYSAAGASEEVDDEGLFHSPGVGDEMVSIEARERRTECCCCEHRACGVLKAQEWCRHWFLVDWIVAGEEGPLTEEFDGFLNSRWRNQVVTFYGYEIREERGSWWRMLVYAEPGGEGWDRNEAEWEMRLPSEPEVCAGMFTDVIVNPFRCCVSFMDTGVAGLWSQQTQRGNRSVGDVVLVDRLGRAVSLERAAINPPVARELLWPTTQQRLA